MRDGQPEAAAPRRHDDVFTATTHYYLRRRPHEPAAALWPTIRRRRAIAAEHNATIYAMLRDKSPIRQQKLQYILIDVF